MGGSTYLILILRTRGERIEKGYNWRLVQNGNIQWILLGLMETLINKL